MSRGKTRQRAGIAALLTAALIIVLLTPASIQAEVTPVFPSGVRESEMFDYPEFSLPEAELNEEEAEKMQLVLDGIFSQQLEEHEIPGLAAVVVKDGETVYSQGLGYASLKEKEAFDPAEHLIRPGSVGKIFTWIAVLQQVEAGELDLYRDVNQYLPEPYRLNPPGNNYVTLRDLMTHSAGFEDRMVGILSDPDAELKSLEDYIAGDGPALVRPSGEVAAYSNYGTTLAGYLVEVVSGMPYTNYLEENIFQPLNMGSSTVRQPLPEKLEDRMSRGYNLENGRFIPGDFEVFQEYPAGGHTVSPADMSRLLTFLLAEEGSEEQEILSLEYRKKLLEILFQQHPETAGFSHGLMEYDLFGEKMFWHGGDTRLFHSGLFILPDRSTGIFVTYNGPGGTFARLELLRALGRAHWNLDYQVPLPAEDPELAEYTGNYYSTRRAQTTPEKLLAVLNQVRVRSADDYLLVSGYRDRAYYPLERDVFVSQTGGDYLYFTRDGDDRVEMMFEGNNPVEAYERQPWHQNYLLHSGIVLLALLSYILTLLVNIRRLFKGSRVSGLSTRSRIPSWPEIALALLGLIFLGLQVLIIYQLLEAPYGWPALMGLAGLLPIVMLLLIIKIIYQLIRKGPLARGFINQLLLVIISLSFILLLYNYNFIGFGVFF